ncbi:Predicted PurR-regulated permease PerM [Bradyrhizobium lablabi]|uniref:Predicted PurR-regulated permease PerM n=1 Tax=Bradyrhizobium lablabi TaxID=722472 RepID=A0A1M6X8N3_9BRAD|nr:AI-2E family transporter [Bradyrhizobium lablabi]SHL02278.1 Predicted PurR-regulated permease PerM [Bradyrhizobium lablabi]
MTEPKVNPDRIAENVQRLELSSEVEGAGRGFTLAAALCVLSVVLGILLIWRTSSSLLIIFAGILFASFLDACARALGPVIPLGRVWRLTLVILALTALIVLGAIWGVGKIPEQARLLIHVIEAQLDVLQQRLQSIGVDLFGPDGDRDLSRWFPDHDKLFGHAQTAVGTASSFLANTLVIVFLGLLFSFDPRAYRDGVVLLVRPMSRQRVRGVLDEMGSVLRLWLVGQLIRIVLMTACVWLALYLLGLPGPFLLGAQAGLSNFVPYLGPILAAIPVALVAMPLGPAMLIWAVGIYTAIQSIEGYVIGPLIQRQAVELPPAWTLVAIVLFGSLFGVMGIALAVPLFAVGRVAVLRLYVEDWLRADLG